MYNYADLFHLLQALCFLAVLTGMPFARVSNKLLLLALPLFVLLFISVDIPLNDYSMLEMKTIEKMPDDCILVSPRPDFYTHERKYSIDEFFQIMKISPTFFNESCVYFIEDMLCFTEHQKINMTDKCDKMKKYYGKEVEEFSYGNLTYSLYRINNKIY